MLAYSGHVMTLANSIIGVGILAMPFCFQKCGIILSIVLLILSNWITRICCHYLIKSSLLTRRKSYEFLGFHAFGSSGKLLVELCIIGYLLGTCITYFVVVGDLGPQIIAKMFAMAGSYSHLRTWVMVIVTLVCILPLGMLKNVDSLSAVCTASIGFYICLVVKIVLESEDHIVAHDWTQKVVYWEPAGIMQCLPIFSMALSCQMQLFEVFGSINNQSLEKLNSIVRNATWICTCVYIAVGFFGYVAFCTQPFSGNILINLSVSVSSDIIKIGFILSVAFSFPLVIFPCRASIYSLLFRKGHADATGYIPEARFKGITIFIVIFTLCIALMIPSVELIIGLVGSTIGVAICIMFPASCFRKIVKKESTERMLAQFIFIGGFCLMILGTYANLNAIDEKSSGAHLQTVDEAVNKIMPTHVPLLVGDDKLALLEQKVKKVEQEYKKEAEAAAKEKPPKLINIEKPVAVDENVRPAGKMAVLSPPDSPVPPLPVDEKHNEETAKKSDKLQVISPEPEVKIVPLPLNQTNQKLPAELPHEKLKVAEDSPQLVNEVIKEEPKILEQEEPQKQQTIDKDAIKKDEEIAAEENNKDTKANADELKKTQKELKKTQELLERKVDELRVELAKQNKETQHLVVEKLGEVVEKVEEIERKVHQNEPQAPSDDVNKDSVPADVPEEANKPMFKDSLLSMLVENAKDEQPKQPQVDQVYEPDSYKAGELLEHAKNGSSFDKTLPLPLALLMNASQAKVNESLNLNLPQKPESVPTVAKPIGQGEKPAAPPLLKNEVRRELRETTPSSPQAALPCITEDATIKPADEDEQKDKLQYIKSLLSPLGEITPRAKRASNVETPNFEAVNQKLQRENCLHEPRVEALMAHGQSNALDFKMHGIVHDLKSLKKKERT